MVCQLLMTHYKNCRQPAEVNGGDGDLEENGGDGAADDTETEDRAAVVTEETGDHIRKCELGFSSG